MRTNIDIDDELIAQAMRAVGATTKREAVELGLRSLLRLERQKAAIEHLRGMGWEGNLDEMRESRFPEWG